MIPATAPVRNIPPWQAELARAFTRPADLLSYLGLPADLPRPGAGLREFPIRVPRGFAELMQRGDPLDPLFLQVWADAAEDLDAPGFSDDAVGELDKARHGGLVHKYHGRVLVMATGACAIHCRYCFRRHFPYSEQLASRDHWRGALAEIASDPSIHEVILSGGDPLSLPDHKLSEFATALEFIPHVTTLRLHTRLPVVLPERVDADLLKWLSRGRLRKVLVVHANHAHELGAAFAAAMNRLRPAGVHLLNQSVLLKNVNDQADALENLSIRLFDCGVLPYYLHMLDRVRGAAHFEVTEERARDLLRAVSARLPGYLVPRLVREEAGAPAKTPVAGP